MSPLTIIERHGHKSKSLPNIEKDALEGIDATYSAGWLDLKVRNDTNNIYQLNITFDDKYMYGKLLSNKEDEYIYKIENKDLKYIKKDGKIYEKVSVIKKITNKKNFKDVEYIKLYDECVLIDYKLPKIINIEEENSEKN